MADIATVSENRSTPTSPSSPTTNTTSTEPIRLPDLRRYNLADTTTPLNPLMGIGSFRIFDDFANGIGPNTLTEIETDEILPSGSKLYSADVNFQGTTIPIEILELANGQKKFRLPQEMRLLGLAFQQEDGHLTSLKIESGPLSGTEFKVEDDHIITASRWRADLNGNVLELDPKKGVLQLAIKDGPLAGSYKWDTERNRFIGLTMQSDLGACELSLNFGNAQNQGDKVSGRGLNTEKIGTSKPELSLEITEGAFLGTVLNYDRSGDRFYGNLTTAMGESIQLTCGVPRRPGDPLSFSGTIGTGDSAIQFSTSADKENTLNLSFPIGSGGAVNLETNSDDRIALLRAEFPSFTFNYSDGSQNISDNEKSNGNEAGTRRWDTEAGLARNIGLDRFLEARRGEEGGFNLSFQDLEDQLEITSARFDTSGRFTGGSAAFRVGGSQDHIIRGNIDVDVDGSMSVGVEAPLFIDGNPAHLKLSYRTLADSRGLWEGEFTRGSETYKLQYCDGEWRLFGKENGSFAFLTGLNKDGRPFLAGSYEAGEHFSVNVGFAPGRLPQSGISWQTRF